MNQARQSGDASAARQVMANGLWSVFAMLLDKGAARGVHREEKSAVASARVVAATRDQLAEQLWADSQAGWRLDRNYLVVDSGR